MSCGEREDVLDGANGWAWVTDEPGSDGQDAGGGTVVSWGRDEWAWPGGGVARGVALSCSVSSFGRTSEGFRAGAVEESGIGAWVCERSLYAERTAAAAWDGMVSRVARMVSGMVTP